MDITPNQTEQIVSRQRRKVFFGWVMFQISVIFGIVGVLGGVWFGYLAFVQFQSIELAQQQLAPLYLAVGIALTVSGCGTLAISFIVQIKLKQAEDQRDFVNLFAYFCNKYIGDIGKVSEENTSHEEILEACRRASVDIRERNIRIATELDAIIRLYAAQDLDQTFADLAGFIRTLKRHANTSADDTIDQQGKTESREQRVAISRQLVVDYLAQQLAQRTEGVPVSAEIAEAATPIKAAAKKS